MSDDFSESFVKIGMELADAVYNLFNEILKRNDVSTLLNTVSDQIEGSTYTIEVFDYQSLSGKLRINGKYGTLLNHIRKISSKFAKLDLTGWSNVGTTVDHAKRPISMFTDIIIQMITDALRYLNDDPKNSIPTSIKFREVVNDSTSLDILTSLIKHITEFISPGYNKNAISIAHNLSLCPLLPETWIDGTPIDIFKEKAQGSRVPGINRIFKGESHASEGNYPQNYTSIYSEEDAKIIAMIADLIAENRYNFPKLDDLQRILNKNLNRHNS